MYIYVYIRAHKHIYFRINNTLYQTETQCNTPQYFCERGVVRQEKARCHTATHCNTLQYTATHCNTMQPAATHLRARCRQARGSKASQSLSSCAICSCAFFSVPLLQRVAVCCDVSQCFAVCRSVSQCVAVCCSVLQCVAVCCSVLQCVAVCCSVLIITRINESCDTYV